MILSTMLSEENKIIQKQTDYSHRQLLFFIGYVTNVTKNYTINHETNTIVIYSKYYSVFEPYYRKVLELICCGNSIVAVVI